MLAHSVCKNKNLHISSVDSYFTHASVKNYTLKCRPLFHTSMCVFKHLDV